MKPGRCGNATRLEGAGRGSGRWWTGLLMLMLAVWLQAMAPRVSAQTFLPPDQAFGLTASVQAADRVALAFRVAPGYYLYRSRLEVKLDGQSLTPELPPGERKHDPTFDEVMEVYHHDVTATLRVPPGQPGATQTLVVVHQGCADAGLCYPPQTTRLSLVRDGQGAVASVAPVSGAGGGVSPGQASGAASSAAQGGVEGALASGRLLLIIPAFLLAGLLLSLTPCVLPMVPILSSIIVGHGQSVGRARGFALALAYSQGMALVYTLLGVAAGLLGQGLAAWLQNPWVLLAVALLMVLLALSMFGLYELQLPPAVQSWLGRHTQGLPGGRFVSVFLMGAVSALVVSPCVSAPLAGALLFISRTGDVLVGGVALYSLAWGMSVPLLVVGLSAGHLLPRAGGWMKAVKAVFGVLMIGMALWVARPAFPVLWAAVTGQSVAKGHQSVLPFRTVKTVAELEAAVKAAAAQGQPVMLDFYADWCVACIEMERETFVHPEVRQRLSKAVLLQVDVTANDADDRALLQRFELFGPPAILFFDPSGRELTGARVVGFQKPELFLQSLTAAGL